MQKRIDPLRAGALVLVLILLAACAETDVVAKFAKTSFAAMLEASKDRPTYAEKESSWILRSPGGDAFSFPAGLASSPDFRFDFDASPFLAAGLDPGRLPRGGDLSFEVDGGRLRIGFELGSENFAADAKEAPDKAFAAFVAARRDRIGYHEELDHYGIALGGGNMFEWAKDLAKNDKDIVFVLDPGPFLKAGLDPAKLSGWIHGKVTVKDEKGKSVQVDKLLRPYNLK